MNSLTGYTSHPDTRSHYQVKTSHSETRIIISSPHQLQKEAHKEMKICRIILYNQIKVVKTLWMCFLPLLMTLPGGPTNPVVTWSLIRKSSGEPSHARSACWHRQTNKQTNNSLKNRQNQSVSAGKQIYACIQPGERESGEIKREIERGEI